MNFSGKIHQVVVSAPERGVVYSKSAGVLIVSGSQVEVRRRARAIRAQSVKDANAYWHDGRKGWDLI